MNSLFALIISIFFLLICACIGRAVHRLWRSDAAIGAFERLVVDSALGMGTVSLVIFAVGASQLLSKLWVFLAILLAVSLKYVPETMADIFGSLKTFARGCRGAFSEISAAFFIVLAVAALIPALAPPSMSDWDSLAYHLSVPKMYLQHGGIYYINFTSHSNFPFLMEMLYIPGLAIGSVAAAKLMNYWAAVLLAASIWMLAKRHFCEKSAYIAVLSFVGMPIVLWEATTAYIDLSTALYTVLCIYLLFNYFDTDNRQFLFGSAISAGFACSTKMTALAVVPLAFVWIIAENIADKKKPNIKIAFLFAFIALLVCSPWYIKSIIYTGNPVYPFFYSIFGGKDWTSGLANTYSSLQAKFGMGHDFTSFIFLPYDLTFYSEKYYDAPGLFVGPVLLLSLPLLCFAKYKSKKLIGLLCFFILQIVIWFKLSQQSRYLLPDFALLSVIIASLLYTDERLKAVRAVYSCAFVFIALFGVYTLLPSVQSSAKYVLGEQTQDQFLSQNLDIYSCDKFVSEHLPKDAKVALYGDTRGFYLNRQYVWADPGHNALFTRDFNSEDDLIKYWKSQKITHVFINHRLFPSPNKAKGLVAYIYQAIDDGELKPVCSDEYTPYSRPAVYEIR